MRLYLFFIYFLNTNSIFILLKYKIKFATCIFCVVILQVCLFLYFVSLVLILVHLIEFKLLSHDLHVANFQFLITNFSSPVSMPPRLQDYFIPIYIFFFHFFRKKGYGIIFFRQKGLWGCLVQIPPCLHTMGNV